MKFFVRWSDIRSPRVPGVYRDGDYATVTVSIIGSPWAYLKRDPGVELVEAPHLQSTGREFIVGLAQED